MSAGEPMNLSAQEFEFLTMVRSLKAEDRERVRKLLILWSIAPRKALEHAVVMVHAPPAIDSEQERRARFDAIIEYLGQQPVG